MTKKELEQALAQLSADYVADTEQKDSQIFDLEEENEILTEELERLRGYVPPFPDLPYHTSTTTYVKEFNSIRHLKELPQ